jgi:hypothetical protein
VRNSVRTAALSSGSIRRRPRRVEPAIRGDDRADLVHGPGAGVDAVVRTELRRIDPQRRCERLVGHRQQRRKETVRALGEPVEPAEPARPLDVLDRLYGQSATQTVRYSVIPRQGAGGVRRSPGRLDEIAPLIRRLRIAPSSIDPAAPHPSALVSFRPSEQARVLVSLRRASGSASRTQHPRARELSGRVGRNHFRLRARIGRRTLRAGAYRLTLVVVDRTGNRSRPATARFSAVG